MTQKPTEPKIGDQMPDGTLYAGISQKTGNQMYIGVQDSAGKGSSLTFNEVVQAFSNLANRGHHYRLPTKDELPALMRAFNTRSSQTWTADAWTLPTKGYSRVAVAVPIQSPKPPKP